MNHPFRLLLLSICQILDVQPQVGYLQLALDNLETCFSFYAIFKKPAL